MKQKKINSVLWALLAATLFVLVAFSGYRWLSSLSLTDHLQQNVRITRIDIWQPFAQIDNMPVKVEIAEEAERQIIDLITAPTYYRTLLYRDSGGDTFFMIYLKGQDDSGTVHRYSYRISNLGEISISNLDTGGEESYLMNDHNPFVISRQKPREFYDKVAALSGYSG